MKNPHGSNLALLYHRRDEKKPDFALASLITPFPGAGSLPLHRGHQLHHLSLFACSPATVHDDPH